MVRYFSRLLLLLLFKDRKLEQYTQRSFSSSWERYPTHSIKWRLRELVGTLFIIVVRERGKETAICQQAVHLVMVSRRCFFFQHIQRRKELSATTRFINLKGYIPSNIKRERERGIGRITFQLPRLSRGGLRASRERRLGTAAKNTVLRRIPIRIRADHLPVGKILVLSRQILSSWGKLNRICLLLFPRPK